MPIAKDVGNRDVAVLARLTEYLADRDGSVKESTGIPARGHDVL
jgi:hypothetical protein